MNNSEEVALTCFVCLRTESDEYYSLFDADLRTPNMTIIEKIRSCFELTVYPEENTNIPNKICSRCLDDLTATWRFKKNCQRANKTFANLAIEYDVKVSSGLEITRVEQNEKYSVANSVSEHEEGLCDVIIEDDSQEDDPQIEQNVELENFAVFYETEEMFEEELTDTNNTFQEQSDILNKVVNIKENIKIEPEELNNKNQPCDKKRRKGRAKKDILSERITDTKSFGKSLVISNDNTDRITASDNDEPFDLNETNSDTDLSYKTKSTSKSKKHSAPKICDICGNSYKYQHTLNAHMRRHTNDRPFPCEFCDKSFVSGVEMHRHMRVHTGHKPYSCKHCDRKFSDFGSRSKHERTHTGERPYCCPTCGKTFAYAHVLTVHLRTHTGEKKFQCTQCDKGFTKKVYLKAHIEQHARSTASNERNELLSHLTSDLKSVELEECIITEYIDNDEIENEHMVKVESIDESSTEDVETDYKYIIKVQ